MQIIAVSYLGALVKAPYEYIYETYRICTFDDSSVLLWWLAFVGVDFAYYWFHRLAHEMHLFWSSHLVHHSSEEYNLTTALRQSFLQPVITWMFYMPMAFVVPHKFMYFHNQWSAIYQFWIHTRMVKSLGPLEFLLNTPSHHRVHHGRNPIYIDKNYGGTLIVWDHIFNTFEPESQPVVYGITSTPTTWNPIVTQLHNFKYLYFLIGKTEGLFDKFMVLWRGPGWVPEGMESHPLPEVTPETIQRYDSRLPHSFFDVYVVVHFLLTVAIQFTLIATKSHLHPLFYLCGSLLTVLSLTSFAALYDNWRHGLLLEAYRVLLMTVVVVLLMWWHYGVENGLWSRVCGFVVAGAVVSVTLLAVWRKDYYKWAEKKYKLL
eukprot:TRINITY_DN1501_c0_g1_i1.p1 TRINITY_DN1501_c0_g1~~TRINITY_DN1501_c0_g1_i1.p1  ORF type:complete len:375 (-),score=65.26 TRINITY_DN1501_c0_g1_i1:613-1737(-)